MLQARKAALVIVKQAAKSAITSAARLHRGAHTHSSRMKDLKASSVADFKEWFDGVDAFLCDCDGVLWRGNDGIKFVDDTYKALVASGKRVFFVTNNSTKSRHDYVHKLEEAAGIQCKHDEIISSAYAASVYAKSNGITAAYVLGGAGLVTELQEAGVTKILGPEDWAKEFSFGTMNPSEHLDPDVQAVIIGFDGRFCYYKLAMASMYLRYQKGCKFVATNKDASYPDTHCFVPGGGSLVQSLETGSGRKPDVVAGKPSSSLLDLIVTATGIDRARTCMVGDRLDTDILFGNSGGLGSSLLVLTGVSSVADAAKYPEGDHHRPTHFVDSFGSLAALIAAANGAGAATA